MKKIIFTIIISLFLISSVSANTIEQQLKELKSNVENLKTDINNLEKERLNKTYPVGSIYTTTNYSTTSQVTNALGGTWETYGAGRVLVGVNTSDTNFNSVNKTGGSATTSLSTANLPSHTHTIPVLSGNANTAGKHNHNLSVWSFNNENNSGGINRYGLGYKMTGTHAIKTSVNTSAENTWGIYAAGDHTHTVTTKASTTGAIGNGTSFTNLQPYITVYRYKRVS